jgi:hypothetical protein
VSQARRRCTKGVAVPLGSPQFDTTATGTGTPPPSARRRRARVAAPRHRASRCGAAAQGRPRCCCGGALGVRRRGGAAAAKPAQAPMPARRRHRSPSPSDTAAPANDDSRTPCPSIPLGEYQRYHGMLIAPAAAHRCTRSFDHGTILFCPSGGFDAALLKRLATRSRSSAVTTIPSTLKRS